LWKRIVELGWDQKNSTIEELSKELGIAPDIFGNQEHLKKWKWAKKDLREIQETSKEKRLKFLENLATKYALQNNLSQEKAIREL